MARRHYVIKDSYESDDEPSVYSPGALKAQGLRIDLDLPVEFDPPRYYYKREWVPYSVYKQRQRLFYTQGLGPSLLARRRRHAILRQKLGASGYQQRFGKRKQWLLVKDPVTGDLENPRF